MLQAVFFDLFETLITEFDPDWKPGATIANQLGVDVKLFDPEWRAQEHKRIVGAYPDFRSTLREICQILEHPVDESLLERMHRERLAQHARVFTRIDNKVLHALKGIKRAKLKLGLISNCTPEEVATWHTCCLAEIFDDAGLSWQIGHAKPELEIYVAACDRLGIKPAHCLFVGDGGSDELAGASRAGMSAYWCTWFLDRWPHWKRSEPGRENTSAFPRLRAPDQLIQLAGNLP